MAISIDIVNISVADGKPRIRFSTKREYEFPNVAAVREEVKARADEAAEWLEWLAMAIIAKRAPNLTNVGAIIGHGLVLDLNAPANIVRLT